MQALLSFFKSRQFLIQLGLIILFIFLSLFITTRWLTSYTSHGEFVTVPDFKGKKIGALAQFIDKKDVAYKIIDSIYDPKQESGIVIRQDPDPETRVKHNRTVYLYVTGMVAPRILMPKLVDMSERQARLVIETYGLKLGRISERAADCNGCVMAQSIKGKAVEPGKPVKKGSVVDIVVGRKDAFYSSSGPDSTAKKTDKPVDDEDKNE